MILFSKDHTTCNRKIFLLLLTEKSNISVKQLSIIAFLLLVTVSQILAQPNDLRITYDANQGQSGLVGASKVYMYSGAVTSSPTGQWEWITGSFNLDDGIGEMTPMGNNVWTICIDPLNYYSSGIAGPIPPGSTIYAINLFFRNADGTQFGYDFNGNYILLNLINNPPSSSFSGVSTGTCGVGFHESSDNFLSISSHPNPVTDQMIITINSSKKRNSNLQIEIRNAIGKNELIREIKILQDGLSIFPLDVKNLKTGIYFLTVSGDDGKTYDSRIFVKTNTGN
jgi:hypothetical protein